MPKNLRHYQFSALHPGLAILAAAFFYYAQRPINHDSGWFMYAARGMLAGGTLYRNFIDVNAPMAYFTLMPAAWLSGLPFFSNEAAFTFNILIYVLIAYGLCAAVLGRMNLTAPQLAVLRAALLIILCFMPHYAFGQREHIFAALLMPYALAAGLRSEGRGIPRGLAIACGIAAGFAVSIKLPYAIVPVFIEAAVLLRRQSWKIAFTYDLLALVASAALINLGCFAFYPEYWTNILPSAVALYGPYNNFQFLSDALFLQVPLFAVGFASGEYRGRGALIGTRWTFAGAVLGALALFILQRKGWPHHALPALMMMGALFVLNLADIRQQAVRDRATATLRAGAASIALIGAFVLAIIGGNVDPGMLAEVEARIKQTDGSFYIISTGNYPAFPLALNPAYKWTSRYPQTIMLPGLIEADMNGAPSPYGPEYHAAVLEDLQRGHPATIFLYVPVDAGGVDGAQMLGWFMTDPAFEKEWQTHYRQTGNTGPFAVYGRK